MSRSRWITATFVVAALALGGCGDDEEERGGDATGTATEQGTQVEVEQPVVVDGTEANFHGAQQVSGEIEFELDTNYFEPTVLVGEPGATVTLTASNHADIAHTFTVREQDIDVRFDPGQEETIEVTMPDSGSVGFICRFHEEQGMVGQLRAQQ